MSLRVERKSPGWEFLGIRFDGVAIFMSAAMLFVFLLSLFIHQVGRKTSTGTSLTEWADLSDFQVITPAEDTAWTLQIGSEKPFSITFGDITYQAFARPYGYSWSDTNRYETGIIPFKGGARIKPQARELHFTSSENLTVQMTTRAVLRTMAEVGWVLLFGIWILFIRRGHRQLVTSDRINAEMALKPHGQSNSA